MNITILGATGMAGSRLTIEARRRGHDVTAYARSNHVSTEGSYDVVTVEATSPAAMERLARKHDALIFATRPHPGKEGDAARLAATVRDAAHAHGRCVIMIGGAAPLKVEDSNHCAIDDPRYVPPEWRDITQASIEQHRVFLEHPADCVYVSRSAQFEPGERTGSYTRGTEHLLTNDDGESYVSAEDLAVAVLNEIEHPHPGVSHFTVTSPSPRPKPSGRG